MENEEDRKARHNAVYAAFLVNAAKTQGERNGVHWSDRDIEACVLAAESFALYAESARERLIAQQKIAANK